MIYNSLKEASESVNKIKENLFLSGKIVSMDDLDQETIDRVDCISEKFFNDYCDGYVLSDCLFSKENIEEFFHEIHKFNCKNMNKEDKFIYEELTNWISIENLTLTVDKKYKLEQKLKKKALAISLMENLGLSIINNNVDVINLYDIITDEDKFKILVSKIKNRAFL